MSEPRCVVMVLSALLAVVLAGTAQGEELEDPMRPGAAPEEAVAAPPAEPEWILTSTVVGNDRRLAVINGQRVRTGEQVDGAEVLRIDSGSVTIVVDGDHRILRLGPGIQVRSSSDRGSE